MDEYRDGVALHFVSPSVDAMLELIARQHRAWPIKKIMHQRELTRSQRLTLSIVLESFTDCEVKSQISGAKRTTAS